MDFYDTLGVPRDVNESELKGAYHKAASKTHPDVEGGSAEKFALVKAAYDTLKDPKKRDHYDATGEAPNDQSAQRQARAMQEIFQSLAQQIMRCDQWNSDYRSVDFLAEIKNVIGIKKAQAEAKKANVVRDLARKKDLPSLFHAKDGKANRISAMIEAENRKLEQMIGGFDEEIATMELALEIANDHDFDFAPQTTAIVDAGGDVGGTWR